LARDTHFLESKEGGAGHDPEGIRAGGTLTNCRAERERTSQDTERIKEIEGHPHPGERRRDK
jgi:hypothetical protein